MGELKAGKSFFRVGTKDNSPSQIAKGDTTKLFGAKSGTEGSKVLSRITVAKSSEEELKTARDVSVKDPVVSPMTKNSAQEASNSVDRGVDNFAMLTGDNRDQKRGKSSSKVSNISDARSNLVKIFQGHGNLMTGCGLTSNEVVTKDKKRKDQIDESSSGTSEEKSSDDIEELKPESDVGRFFIGCT